MFFFFFSSTREKKLVIFNIQVKHFEQIILLCLECHKADHNVHGHHVLTTSVVDIIYQQKPIKAWLLVSSMHLITTVTCQSFIMPHAQH